MVRAPMHRVHNVLIVDDSPEVLEAIACLLDVHGCRVVTAKSGGEVFDAFERGLRPCMMLLDIRMPDMDGWAVCDRMRVHDEWQHTAVVIVSGELPDPERARASGLRGFLKKPRMAPDIVDAVEQHCRVASAHRAPSFALWIEPVAPPRRTNETTLLRHYGRFVHTTVADARERAKIDPQFRRCPHRSTWTRFGHRATRRGFSDVEQVFPTGFEPN